MVDSIFYTRHDGGITLMKNGKQSTVSSTHQNFDRIVDALKNRRFDELEDLMNVAATINKTGFSKKRDGCKVFVKNGEVFFLDTRNRKEVQLNGALVDRILNDLGKPIAEKYADYLMALLENIQKNPVKDVAAELYEWLASGKAPITSDGCILAYKKVNKQLKDHYTGKMDNSPGIRVRMPQADVDTNRRNECSRGLHFASLGYLKHYSGEAANSRVVIVKVNPRHIFAIPKDYNCQKGRASEYLVVGEYISDKREENEAFKDSFIDEDNMLTAAPEVKFIKNGLRPSLESVAEDLGLVVDSKVRVVKLSSGGYQARDWNTSDKDAITMSFETKSVRAAVKTAVEKMKK